MRRSRFAGAAFALGALAACGGESAAPRFVESALVAAGRVLDANEAPVQNAIVLVQTLRSGKPGGEFGCTGAGLTGHWAAFTDPAGRFTVGMGQRSDGTPICVVVLPVPAGDSTWRDTAAVVRRFPAVAPGVAPDTVHFDLRLAP